MGTSVPFSPWGRSVQLNSMGNPIEPQVFPARSVAPDPAGTNANANAASAGTNAKVRLCMTVTTLMFCYVLCLTLGRSVRNHHQTAALEPRLC